MVVVDHVSQGPLKIGLGVGSDDSLDYLETLLRSFSASRTLSTARV